MNADITTRFVPEYRRTNFKNRGHFKPEELRRRRESAQIEIRKAKRDETLTKRRNLDSFDATIYSDDEEVQARAAQDQFEAQLPGLLQDLDSNEHERQLTATTIFRKVLSRAREPPIAQVVESGAARKIIGFLSSSDTLLQFEAAWALTNIASGSSDQTRTVIEAGAVSELVKLLSSPELDVKEQAVWALGNIAGDSTTCRDVVLQGGALLPLLTLLDGSKKLSLMRNGVWTLSNLCRGRSPEPDWNLISQALPTLARLLYSFDDEVLIDACWAVSYLSDGDTQKIQAVIDAGLPRRLVELLHHDFTTVQTPALRCVGNIVTGNDFQTQHMITAGALPALLNLLSSKKDSIRKEACWTLSNIAAGNSQQIQAIIDNNLIPPLIHLMSTSDFKTRKEACWVISNATSGASVRPDQIRYLVSEGCLKPFCDLLASDDNKIITVALDGLDHILKVGELDAHLSGSHENEYALLIEEIGGLDLINECQNSANDAVYEKAYGIIENYFGDEEEMIDDVEIAPSSSNGGYTFGFGSIPPQLQSFKF